MIRGKKYVNKDVAYVSLKKHPCPHCGNRLKTVKVSRVVNYHSPEAKDFDFEFGSAGHLMTVTGDVKFSWEEFECPDCGQHFTVEQLKELEGVDQSDGGESGQPKSNNKVGLILFFVIGALILLAIGWCKNTFG